MKNPSGKDMASKDKKKKTKVSNFSRYDFKFTKVLEQAWLYNFAAL